jgi:hypothetical protein
MLLGRLLDQLIHPHPGGRPARRLRTQERERAAARRQLDEMDHQAEDAQQKIRAAEALLASRGLMGPPHDANR